MSYNIGIDVGGTFTDLFLWSREGGAQTFKVLSTPTDPSLAVMEGMSLMADSQGLSAQDFAGRTSLIVHGTTVTTNAVLTRGGARTGLITTEGVRDALEMRRGIREEQYNNRFTNVVPVVPRRLRLTAPGRLDAQGEETTPLDVAAVRAAARSFRDRGVEAVAICFMHSYANHEHEREAARVLREEMPEAFLSPSFDVLPTIRFYERVSTTALNAYVGPVLGEYLGSLQGKLSEVGFGGVLLIMQSNGGVALPELTQKRPATTLLSGPAGGPRAAATLVEHSGRDSCILVDMGGTSFDASLVRDGSAALSSDGEIDRLRIALPMLEITTIGAGGGSIGWIDEGGLLRMGPASAGALPGPACYGRGGELPACTDADLLLGYLDPTFFAGGKMVLDAEAAQRAIEAHVAEPLGLTAEQAAAGMYRVINANMAHGVREITVKRGLDPREFPMVVAGGAGSLHACPIAAELEIPEILVPRTSSTLCATGMLLSDLQHDEARSHIGVLDRLDLVELRELAESMVRRGEEELSAEGARTMRHELALDLRYLKQYHEVTVPVPEGALERGDLAAVAEAFHAAHDRLYGYNLESESTPLELINLRVRSIGGTEKPTLPRLERGDETPPAAAMKGRRRAYVPESDAFADLPVLDGHALLAGNRIEGPALIERTDTTIFISADWVSQVDDVGSIVLRARKQESHHG
jgi:N-methylhydantoinase A